MKKENIELVRMQAGVGVPKLLAGMLVFAVSALLLNAGALYRSASLLEFGRARHICLTLIAPVNRFSEKLHVDRMRSMVESINLREVSDAVSY